jgi:DMSO reductase family type II enzyme molybdopterin subunit
MKEIKLDRRQFLQISGASALMLSMHSLGFLGGNAHATEKVIREWDYGKWEDLHRKEWTWDKVTWGTHLVDCYPGNCLWRVYTRDGVVFREEQAAKYPVIDPTGPDFNPRGCQKGAFYSHMMYNPDRLKYPMKRVGERGSGKWKRVSWDEALSGIASGILDGMEEQGPESFVFEMGPGNGGYLNIFAAMGRLSHHLGATALDLDSTIGDFNRGIYESVGKFMFMDSVDGWFFGKLLLIWHMNPVYTRIPSYHFIASSRYNGAEVVTIAPDYSPSAMHADEWVPVEPGGDAALGLAICQVLIEEDRLDLPFVKEQTDLPLLVRKDSGRFLRVSEVEEGGRDDQFYFWDAAKGELAKAPLETLKLPVDPALEGTFTVSLLGGGQIEVEPSFQMLKEQLNKDYTPEKASKQCKTHPDTIRRLADKCARADGHIQVLVGWNSPKYYHGDLIERAMCLLLALTGSYGKKGSGIRGWNESLFEGALFQASKPSRGWMGATIRMARGKRLLNQLKAEDPTLTDEMLAVKLERLRNRAEYSHVPPAFLYYFHSGYKDAWDRKEWHCPSMKREFPEYMKEALDKGWWEGLTLPYADQEPRVYCYYATSPARKNRGWNKNILPSLWKKYKLIYGFETRWSTTALYSDYILPCAGFYEKLDTRFPTPHVPWLTLTEKAVEPPGEAMNEWEICLELAGKIEEEANRRGKTKFHLRKGREIDLNDLKKVQSLGCKNLDEIMEDALETSVSLGNLPRGTDLAKMRKEGIVRFVGLSIFDPITMHLSTDIKPDEPIVPLTWHTGSKKLPYPTYNRRLQFYIDHPWFLEAGEQMPVHKPTPKMGGDYPLTLTSGHQRWSVHSIWITDEQLLRTHQGRPFMFMNPEDAKKRGIQDGDLVHVRNDFDDFHIHVKISPAARPGKGTSPGQVIVYHAWEPFMFKGWKSYDTAIPGMVKWLDLAGGYGHLDYYRWNWCIQPIDRAVSVEVEKV